MAKKDCGLEYCHYPKQLEHIHLEATLTVFDKGGITKVDLLQRRRCATCDMPMKLMQFGRKKMYGCENTYCYRPEFSEVKKGEYAGNK